MMFETLNNYIRLTQNLMSLSWKTYLKNHDAIYGNEFTTKIFKHAAYTVAFSFHTMSHDVRNLSCSNRLLHAC